VSSYRASLYRLIFGAAAVYNIAFGLWAGVRPGAFFAAFDLASPRYPSIWAYLGMIVGVYGLGYAYAARHLDRAAPFIAIGLLSKLLGPAGWVAAVSRGEWPIRTVTLILFNDVIWWTPFALFLLEGTRAAMLLGRLAPYACAATNAVAFMAMATVLRHGTEIVADATARVGYIAGHLALWRAGWTLWIAAAVSVVAFYAWWGSHLRDSRAGVVAVSIASVGLACDLAGESLLIGWLPGDYDRVAPLAWLLTGAAANGLYTSAGVVLTLATETLRGPLKALTWAVWIAGAAVTAFTIAQAPLGIAVSTTALFLLFCPWVVILGRMFRL
jgi:hypothetical protein